MQTRAEAGKPGWTGTIFAGAVALMALTGFGQMPIYKRYYLSDIPGLGWLADFHVTRNLHYVGAAVLLALAAYAFFDFWLSRRKVSKLTRSGLLRGWLLAGIAATGAFIVVKNLPYAHFPDGWVIALNLLHLALAMAFLGASLTSLLLKKRWAVPG